MKAADVERLFRLRRGRHKVRDYYAGMLDGQPYRLPVTARNGDMLLVISLKPNSRAQRERRRARKAAVRT